MGWVFFQVFLAFGLGIFIVWWSLPRKKKNPPAVLRDAPRKDASDAEQKPPPG
jgi:hypothetical protein